jgi:D-alanyl-D-alanine dipeptidase
MKLNYIVLLVLTSFIVACTKEQKTEAVEETVSQVDTVPEVIQPDTAEIIKKVVQGKDNSFVDSIISSYNTLPDSSFVELNQLGNTFALDMKYATTDNFLGEQVYDCPKCLIRAVVAKALLKANNEFKDKGYKIKFFDCYRPLYVQEKMWEIKPNTNYVANPKTGSIHNRGAAVDITLVDSTGKELNMGTKFDHFGKEAHHAYTELTLNVIQNRIVLKSIMEGAGFKAQNSEWWHYSFIGAKQFPVSNTPIVCQE